VLAITYDDPHSAMKILHHVKSARPGLSVVVRTADDSHVETLKQAGATEVVAEVLEGSVMLASQALLLSGVPFNRVIRRIQENRARRYSVFSGQFHTADDRVDEVTESLQASLHSVLLAQRDAAVNKTLDEIDLAGLRVVVNAVRRNNASGKQTVSQTISQPPGDTLLQAGDVLMLLGQQDALAEAEIRLREG
jgi:CPA2 family monovalent cation:H+ antiporter-2